MVDAYEAVDRLRGGLIPVPATPQLGVCGRCHNAAGEGYSWCYQCNKARQFEPPDVLPITMEVLGSLIHDHLRSYKDTQSEFVRQWMGSRLAALLALFFDRHRSCVGEWDLVTCVPSVKRVALAPIVSRVPDLARDYRQVLREWPGRAAHQLSVEHFAVTGPVSGKRVLLLDDTFTTGAALFSSAAAIRQAGGSVIGPVVIGRFVDPRWPPSEVLLQWLRNETWQDDRCARCGGARPEGRLI